MSGENVITHFITAVCHCGSCKITDVHYVSKSGLYKELEDDTLGTQPVNCGQRTTGFLFNEFKTGCLDISVFYLTIQMLCISVLKGMNIR